MGRSAALERRLSDSDSRYNESRRETVSVAIPGETADQKHGEASFEQKLARWRAAPQERARVLASLSPFDYEAWVREAGPATSKELVEMEEFLRGREAERQRSLADEESRSESAGR
jgi:hypothetical protein